MLDHIEQANSRKRSRQHAGVLQGRPHYLPYAAPDSVSNAGKPGLHKDDLQAGLLEGRRDTSIPATNIKERAGGGEESHGFQDATVSMLEPKRRLFYRKAKGVAFLRVRDVRNCGGGPPPARTHFKVWRDFLKIHQRPVEHRVVDDITWSKTAPGACLE